jgi:hypothetical protein
MRFRLLSGDPFTDIGRTIPEFRSLGLAESKESHGFSVDKKNVFEIDGEAARFLFQHAPKHVDMFPCNPAAYKQHHETFSANDSIDSAAHCHCGLSVQSFLLDRGCDVMDLSKHVLPSSDPWLSFQSRWHLATLAPSDPLESVS